MSLVCIASQGESPGATTASLLLTGLWPEPKRSKLFVEADPKGGRLASTYQLNLDPNLVSLAKAVDTGVARKRLWRNAQLLPGSVEAVIGPTKPADVEDVFTAHGEQLGTWLSRLRKIDVFADMGELKSTSSSVEFVSCASMLLMVSRPDLVQLERGAERMRELSDSIPKMGWLLIGDQPYGAKEVEAAFDFPVIGVLADDPQTASALEQGSSVVHLTDAPLVQSATQVVESVQKALTGVAPRKKIRLMSRSASDRSNTPSKKPPEGVEIERPPSLVSEISTNEETITGAPTGGHDALIDLSAVSGARPEESTLDVQPDSNATAQMSAVPTEPPPTALHALREEVAASATVPPIAASKFWESTTRLAAPSLELSAASPDLRPMGSSSPEVDSPLGERLFPAKVDDAAPVETVLGGADDVSETNDASDGEVPSDDDDDTIGGLVPEAVTAPLLPTREMSITEVIETVDTPTGQIDVPPSLISGKTAEKVEVPPSFFSLDPSESAAESGEQAASADSFDSVEDGGIRPPSLLDAKLSTSANSADELPGYPPLR